MCFAAAAAQGSGTGPVLTELSKHVASPVLSVPGRLGMRYEH